MNIKENIPKILYTIYQEELLWKDVYEEEEAKRISKALKALEVFSLSPIWGVGGDRINKYALNNFHLIFINIY